MVEYFIDAARRGEIIIDVLFAYEGNVREGIARVTEIGVVMLSRVIIQL
jgi:hypothetical protein